MTKQWIVVVLLVGLTISCAKGKVGQGEGSKTMAVDTTGLTPEQEKMAGDMVKEIIPLIKAGKSASEVISSLQELDAKKITRYPVEIGDSPALVPRTPV